MTDKILWDMHWINRSNRKLLFWLDRRVTLRLTNLVSKLSLLEIDDIDFNTVLDNLTNWEKINTELLESFLDSLDLLNENDLFDMWESIESIKIYFQNIRRTIIDEINPVILSVKNDSEALCDAGF